MSQDLDDVELLQAARTGDHDAYADLQQRLQPDIERYIRRKILDPYIVDDILQETFLAFYRHLDRIDPPANLRPYLFRIARNKCYDYLRQVQRHDQDVSLDDEPVRLRVSYTEAHRQPRPDDLTHWMLLQLEVQDAIDNLPDDQQETLLLFSEEQLTYAEIADVMDVSIGTVKSRLYYAKKNLRGLLRPETLAVLDSEFSAEPVPIGNRRHKTATHNRNNDDDRTEDEDHERPIPTT